MNDEKECVFCKVANGETDAEVVNKSSNFFAIRDISPITEGHTLIIPKKHVVNLLDLPDNLGNELLEFSKNIAGGLLDKNLGEGFNLVMNNGSVAGQIVFHAHIHVVPRNKGDKIKPITKGK